MLRCSLTRSRFQNVQFATHAKGYVQVTKAAREKMMGQSEGYSLLISDIVSAFGEFGDRGVVSIRGPDQKEFARGMVQMSSDEIKDKIAPLGPDGENPVITFESSHK